jgi:hypothetical protein
MENMTPFNFIIYACATWYISYVITAQSGPFDLLEKARDKVDGLLSCIYCIAPYIAALVYAVGEYHESIGYPVVCGFAIAGLSLMLRSYTGAGVHGI